MNCSQPGRPTDRPESQRRGAGTGVVRPRPPLGDSRNEIARIDRPTQFVWGTEDAFYPPAVGRPVTEKMSHAEFHELPGYGHTPWLEPNDDAVTLVREFLA